MSFIRDRLLGKKLASHEFAEDVLGKPLKIPEINFTIPLEKKVQAVVAGAPYFVVRARQIEKITDQLIEDLTVNYVKMINQYSNCPEVFIRKWEELVKALPLDKLNDLIERHNKYYPIEANLQIDHRSGAPMIGSLAWKPKERITIENLLERFPPDIAVALD